MSGRIVIVWSSRRPWGRQRMMVNQGATKHPARNDPVRQRPASFLTSIASPRNANSGTPRAPACIARLRSASIIESPAHNTTNALTIGSSGMTHNSASVAPPETEMKRHAAPEGARRTL